MIIFVASIVTALVLFAVLRKLAIPVILLLGAGYLYNQFHDLISGQAMQTTASSAVASQLPAWAPMPSSETAVCKALEEARDAFGALKVEFKAAEGEKNAIRRDQLIAQARAKIDRLYSDRNRAVLVAIGGNTPHASQWVVKVTALSTMTKDYGKGSGSYATLKAQLPCHMPVIITSEDFSVASHMAEILGSVNPGDAVLLNGSFVKHDATVNPPEIAVAWGGPLYGPFGGLWTDAMDAPAFRINLSSVERPGR